MKATVTKEFYFDAAHKIDSFGSDHKCARLHGHTWKVRVSIYGEVHPKTGIVIDFYDIESAWKPLRERLDHNYLNEVVGLSTPTTENIAKWIWERMRTKFSGSCALSKISIAEGMTDFCDYSGE